METSGPASPQKKTIDDRSHSRAAGTQGASNAAAKYELRTRHGFGIFKHQEERWVTMKRRLIATIMCVVFVLLVLSGGAPQLSAQSTGKWKVAFPQVGPVGDAGWTYQSDLARRELEKRLDWVETMQVESVGPSDSKRVIEDFIRQGAKVIMVQDPTIMDMVLDIASEHRDRYFLVANAFKYAP